MSSTIEPLLIPDDETAQVAALRGMMESGRAALVGPAGQRHEIPDDVYQLFLRVLSHLQRRQGVSIVPYDEELTTQTAANLLGVSRQFLVRLLEQGKIPFHKAGTHRRIYLKDLLKFKEQRDHDRRKGITEAAQDAVEAGVYDKLPEPDE